MPSLESTGRMQDAVLWSFVRYDSNGEQVVSSPVDIKVRWEQATTAMIGPDNTPIAVNGAVFVYQDIATFSILRLGTVATLPTPVRGGLMEVVSFDKIPDIKGRKFQRTAVVRVFKDTLPTVV